MNVDPNKRLLIVASDTATMNEADAMFARLRDSLFAWKEFMDVCCSVDENDPRQMKRVEIALEKMTLRFMQTYANPTFFDADAATLAQMRTHLETVKRGRDQ
jgi:hypothetical protein